jgi:hypothetical protein
MKKSFDTCLTQDEGNKPAYLNDILKAVFGLYFIENMANKGPGYPKALKIPSKKDKKLGKFRQFFSVVLVVLCF